MRKIEKKTLFEAIEKQLNEKIAQGRTYKDLTPKQYRILRNFLLESQKFICCYCEKEISKEDTHIEHFFEQTQIEGQGKSLDYQFNMLASCTQNPPRKQENETELQYEERLGNLSCGHKKTSSYHKNVTVDYALLLNPMEDVSHLFSYEDGQIQASFICNANEKTRVNYTIKRLNLDNYISTNSRITMIEQLSIQLYDLSIEDKKRFIADIIDETKEKLYPYHSTIKDNFSYILTK
jgi:uncharacterized protein (TIGR02646 family)